MKKGLNKQKIGGMALFDGILLRSQNRECIAQRINNDIQVEINNLESKKSKISNIPLLRGLFSLANAISSSIPYIMSSAKNIVDDIVKDEDVQIEKNEVTTGYIIAIIILLSVFTIIPNIISMLFISSIQNYIQISIQAIMFICYLVLISNIKQLKIVFEYHGAEHKVVNAYECIENENITIEQVKKASRFHKRCGGNFIVYFILLMMVITLLIPSSNLLIKSAIQLVFIPIIIGISYEIIMLFSKLPKYLLFISYPAMAIQYITTKEPSDDKLELAILAMKACTKEKITYTVKEFVNEYIQSTLVDIEYELNDILRVVAKIKQISKDELYITMDKVSLDFSQQIKLKQLLDEIYIKHIPLQYILGKTDFYKETYIVTKDVLIPRADSEILVEKAIEYINKYKLKQMIDMCTGSGCIGISTAKNSTIDKVYLIDISKQALEVTIKNIKLNDIEKVAVPLLSDLFEKIINMNLKFDIVVSNPPYIPSEDIKTLSKDVQNEPHIALDGGKDGLDIYRQIFYEAKLVLNPGGYLLLEIGYDQLDGITKIINSDLDYELIESQKDYNGNDRVVVCRFQEM